MEDFLTPVSTTYLKPRAGAPSLAGSSSTLTPLTSQQPLQSISTPQQALQTLLFQPNHDQLLLVLQYLNSPTARFSIWTPSPEGGQIVSVLAGDITESYWALLSVAANDYEGEEGHADLFLACLLSVTGLNALVAKLRALLAEAKGVGRSGPVRPDICANISLYLDILAALLRPGDTLERLWGNVAGRTSLGEPLKKQLLGEILGLVSGGRILSVAADAEHTVQVREGRGRSWWVADGARFNQWLGKNVASWAKLGAEGEKLAAMAWARGLRLGYADTLSKTIIDALLLSKSAPPSGFSHLLAAVPDLDQKKILTTLISYLSSRFLAAVPDSSPAPNPVVCGVAGLIQQAIGSDATRKSYLVGWLTSSAGAGLGEGIAVRRAVMAAVGENKEDMMGIVEGALGLFGDELYIRHSPALQQEAHAQVLLLAIGHLHRLARLKLVALVRTGGYLSTISNRIAATQTRSRFLGMVVGEALSALVDGEQKRLKFGLPELETEEALWWKGLVNTQDRSGVFDDLLAEAEDQEQDSTTIPKPPPPKATSKPLRPKKAPASSTETKPKPMIQIIDSDSSGEEEEEDDLKPYAKPLYDPEDSDEDPTLITRNRPKPPVYIRTLLEYLRASEDVDKQTLALRHAPRLIRSKAHHGSEVSAHAAELASRFIGLSDNFGMEEFLDMRLRCLVALVVAAPQGMAPWMARSLWEGDLSVSQRVSLMIALGLGGREVAGFQQPEEGDRADWVGERLPERMERLYVEEGPKVAAAKGAALKPMARNAIDTAARDMTAAFLAPLAAEGADNTTGSDALKLSSFKSRLAKSKSTTGPKVRAIPNTTSALLYSSFFSPLHARLTYSLSYPQPTMHTPSVLTTYIKTLGLLVHAAGPSTLSLPQMTAELWDLLLAVRTKCPGDVGVTGAILAALVALLEVNDASGPGGRRVCSDFGKQVVETREWTAMVFGQVRGEGEVEEKMVKALAAGLLVRLDELLEKHQMLLMGSMM